MTTSTYEFVTVTCLTCPTERTVGKFVERELPDWQCGPCKRETLDLYYDHLFARDAHEREAYQ